MDDKEHKDFLWRQFIKLGDMLGDGLGYEKGEEWIRKDYKRLAKILIPRTEEEFEFLRKQRQDKNRAVNEAIDKKEDKCSKCQGDLKQVRSGSLIVQCQNPDCGAKFKYKKKKK